MLESPAMADRDLAWTAENQVNAERSRVPWAEFPVSCRRGLGRSKIRVRWWGSLKAGFKILYTIAR